MTAPLRVLVVDDHPLFREGLTAILRTSAGMEVVGEAADGAQAVEAAARLEPDLVVMDLHMPVMNGIEATRAVLAARPSTAVLVLTMLENDDSVVSALRAGARGYVVKGSSRAEILRAVEAVAAGDVLLGQGVGTAVLGSLAAGSPRGDRLVPFPQLTDRELEVLDLVARGLSNGQIAARLFLSDKTVRNNVSSMLAKLGCSTRAEMIAKARDAGWGAGTGG